MKWVRFISVGEIVPQVELGQFAPFSKPAGRSIFNPFETHPNETTFPFVDPKPKR